MPGSAKLDNVVVLLVDDQAHMRKIWKTIFVGMGITRVTEAGDAAQGFDLLRSSVHDLAVVDYHLSDLNGAEFIRLLRRSPDSPNRFIPVIGCTADTRRSVITEMVDAGADEILAKPVSAREIWSRVHAVIERRREFLSLPSYFGPDRRRRNDPKYIGPERRKSKNA